MKLPLGRRLRISSSTAMLATLVAGTLFVGSGTASADPQTVTVTATCSGGQLVTVTTLINNAAALVFVDGTLPDGSKSVGVVLSETSSTIGPLKFAPPGFAVNGVSATTCTFTPDFAPQLGTINVEVLFTPAGLD